MTVLERRKVECNSWDVYAPCEVRAGNKCYEGEVASIGK